MRIHKAFESKENWYKINCFGAKQWIIFSILMIHIGVISFFILFAQHHLLMTLLILLNYGLNRCIIAVSINRYEIYPCQTFLYLTLAVISTSFAICLINCKSVIMNLGWTGKIFYPPRTSWQKSIKVLRLPILFCLLSVLIRWSQNSALWRLSMQLSITNA